MKQSKNMYFERTQESRELELYIDNTRVLYEHMIQVYRMLDGKMRRNIFDHNKAWMAFYKVCNHANELYSKAFGYRFNTQVRYTVAVILATNYMENRGFFNG